MNEILTKCPECGSKNIYHETEKDETICRDCGLVVENKLPNFGCILRPTFE